MTLKILHQDEKEKILKNLKIHYGIEELPGEIIQIGKERLFLYTGSLTRRELKNLNPKIPVERTGIYFARLQFGELRLSMDGVQLFKDKIKKSIVEINKEQMEDWMHGNELLIKTGLKGFVVIKHGDDFLGCGKASAEKITNFVPKNRRLKFKT